MMIKITQLMADELAMLATLTFSCNTEDEKHMHERCVIDNSQSPYVKLRSIPMQDTELTDGFWEEHFEICTDKMIPSMKKAMLRKGSAKLNLIKFMAGMTDVNPGGKPWGDCDCYKWIEPMAHVFNLNKDPELDKEMDEWI